MTLGFRIEELDKSSRGGLSSRYRGGMRITAVRPTSPAAQNGLQIGDILVGLHIWETLNAENISYVMDHPQLKSFQPLKFYVVRNGETLYGYLPLK